MIDNLFDLYTAGEVQRCHTMRVLNRQSIADHSWGVAVILMWIFEGQPSINVLKAALVHDCPEHKTGDTPATAKWSSKVLTDELEQLETAYHLSNKTEYYKQCTENELMLLKFADMAELVMYCLAEMAMGNGRVKGMAKRALANMENTLHTEVKNKYVPPRAVHLLGSLQLQLTLELK